MASKITLQSKMVGDGYLLQIVTIQSFTTTISITCGFSGEIRY